MIMNDDQSQSGQQSDDFENLKLIIDCLRPLDDEGKIRLLKSAITFLRLDSAFGSVIEPSMHVVGQPNVVQQHASFSTRTEMTPKQFLLEKQPGNDIERTAHRPND